MLGSFFLLVFLLCFRPGGTYRDGCEWSQPTFNFGPKYGTKIWYQNIIPKYRPKIWSPPVLRLLHRACASASTVLRKKAHAHQSIHGKSSICFQSHRRDFWNWVWLHGMRLANLLLLSCSFCFKLKFKSVIFLLSRV